MMEATGIKKIPFSCCKSWYRPSDALATIGAVMIANKANIADTDFPTFTIFRSLEDGLICLL